MKIRSHTRLPVACLSLALFYPFLSDSAFAASYYWDNDGDTPGFGLAAGTWAVPTIGNATQGWSEDSAGTTEPVNVTTTSSDELYFGTATGLGSGSVTVSGNVDANRLTFGSGSGEITVSGGTIALGGTSPRITLNNTGNTISSALTLDANTSVLMGTNAALLLKLDGPIGGTGNLTFTTPATNFNNVDQVINLGVAGSYTGNTLITTGQSANRLHGVSLPHQNGAQTCHQPGNGCHRVLRGAECQQTMFYGQRTSTDRLFQIHWGRQGSGGFHH